MKSQSLAYLLLFFGLVACGASTASAQGTKKGVEPAQKKGAGDTGPKKGSPDPTPKNTPAKGAVRENAVEEAALLANAEAYLDAFHKADAKKVAALWTKDGDYTDQSGRHLKGRDAIEKAFAEFFSANKGAKLRIEIQAQHFVTPDVAIEDGFTEVLYADGAPSTRARYTIVHLKKDGKWSLGSVRESVVARSNNSEHLRHLDWLVGNWTDDSEKGELAKASFSWSESGDFLTGSFCTTYKSVPITGASQWIGWDPVAKHIRSWTFDQEGGYTEGVWSADGKKFSTASTTITRDGKRATATNVITQIDANTLSWESRDRAVDGVAIANIAPIKMKRTK